MPRKTSRRALLTLLGASGLTALGGCLGDDTENSDDDSTDDTSGTPDDQADDPGPDDIDDSNMNPDNGNEDPDEPSNYEVDVATPDTVEAGAEWRYSLTIENTGEGGSDSQAEYVVALEDEDGNEETILNGGVSLGPGESETIEPDPVVISDAGTTMLSAAVVGSDNNDESQTEIQVVPPERA